MSRTVSKPWAIDWSCDTDAYTPEQLDAARSAAQSWLWVLSGRRFGEFVTVEDAYRPPCSSACGMPYKNSDGLWRNGSAAGNDCCRIELAWQPVQSITEVREWGVVIDPADYDLERNGVRRIGACFPCCDDCEPGCVEVDYEWGTPPDAWALRAADELACELLRGFSGEACKLPGRAISVARQGVQIEMDDATTFAENGLTGLPVADSWIRAVNPKSLPFRSRVFSPDAASRA